VTIVRVLITGSAAGLGRLAAESLLDGGHDVIVHAITDGGAPRPTVEHEAGRLSAQPSDPRFAVHQHDGPLDQP
jgi:NAD(P)-dependent dehydrogenase (short-subunit alcohol dehydrogenase family)